MGIHKLVSIGAFADMSYFLCGLNEEEFGLVLRSLVLCMQQCGVRPDVLYLSSVTKGFVR